MFLRRNMPLPYLPRARQVCKRSSLKRTLKRMLTLHFAAPNSPTSHLPSLTIATVLFLLLPVLSAFPTPTIIQAHLHSTQMAFPENAQGNHTFLRGFSVTPRFAQFGVGLYPNSYYPISSMAFPHTTEAARIQCGVFQPSTIANGASDSPLTAKGLRQGPADVHVDQSFSHLQHSLPKSENVSPYNFDTVNQSPGAGPSQPPPMSHKRSRTSGSLTRCSKRRKREDGSSMSFIEVEFTTEAVQMSKKPSKDKGKKLQPEVATIKAPSRHKSLILTTDMKTKAMDGFEGIVSVDTDGIQRYFCLKICPAKDGLPTSSIDGAHLDRHLNSLEHRKGLVKYGSATYTPPRLQYHCPISECTKRLSREDGWNDHFRKCHPDAGASPAELKKKCGGQFVSWDNRPEDKSFLSNLKKKARVLSLFKDYFRFVRPMNEADGLGDSLSPAFETTDSHSFSYLTPSDFEKSPMVPPPPPPNNSTPDSDFVRVADYEHDPISSSSSQFPGLYFAEEQDTSQYTFSGVGEPDDLLIPASSGVAWTGPFSSFAD